MSAQEPRHAFGEDRARSMPLEFDKDEAVAGEQQRPDLGAVQLLRGLAAVEHFSLPKNRAG